MRTPPRGVLVPPSRSAALAEGFGNQNAELGIGTDVPKRSFDRAPRDRGTEPALYEHLVRKSVELAGETSTSALIVARSS